MPLPAEQGPQLRYTGDPATMIVQVAVSDLPFESTTLDTKVKVPAVVGVPEITPAALSVRPGGNVPETNEYVYGAVPPVTDMLAEYAVPTVALPLPQVPQIKFRADGATTMVQVWVSVLPFESTTLDVKVKVPAAVGVPEIAPVVAFSVRPAGNAPELIEKVYGATPPLTFSAAEYDDPTLV